MMKYGDSNKECWCVCVYMYACKCVCLIEEVAYASVSLFGFFLFRESTRDASTWETAILDSRPYKQCT